MGRDVIGLFPLPVSAPRTVGSNFDRVNYSPAPSSEKKKKVSGSLFSPRGPLDVRSDGRTYRPSSPSGDRTTPLTLFPKRVQSSLSGLGGPKTVSGPRVLGTLRDCTCHPRESSARSGQDPLAVGRVLGGCGGCKRFSVAAEPPIFFTVVSGMPAPFLRRPYPRPSTPTPEALPRSLRGWKLALRIRVAPSPRVCGGLRTDRTVGPDLSRVLVPRSHGTGMDNGPWSTRDPPPRVVRAQTPRQRRDE